MADGECKRGMEWFVDMAAYSRIVEEDKALRRELEQAQARVAQLEEALRQAEHSLTTLHGLTASDGLGAYGAALSEGCDANGAWDCYRDETWKIDEAGVLAVIRAAFAASPSKEGTDG